MDSVYSFLNSALSVLHEVALRIAAREPAGLPRIGIALALVIGVYVVARLVGEILATAVLLVAFLASVVVAYNLLHLPK
jgi:hypothetical protein